jgi:hypothetical protein
MSSAACALVQLAIAISIEPNTKDSTFSLLLENNKIFVQKNNEYKELYRKNTHKNQIFWANNLKKLDFNLHFVHYQEETMT